MKTLSNFSKQIQRFTSWKNILTALILLVLVIAVMQFDTKGLEKLNDGPGMLDMCYGYSFAAVQALMTKIGEAGRMIYARLLGIDYLFIIIHTLFQTLMLTRLMQKAKLNAPLSLFNLLPFVRGGLDMLENCLLLNVLFFFPVELPVLVMISSTITLLKWAFHYTILLALFALGTYTSIQGISTRKQTAKVSKSI